MTTERTLATVCVRCGRDETARGTPCPLAKGTAAAHRFLLMWTGHTYLDNPWHESFYSEASVI